MNTKDYTKYGGFDLKEAYDAANAGMADTAKHSTYTQENLEEARAFIAQSPLFANFNKNASVPAAEIKASIRSYYDERPDQNLDVLATSLVNRWVIGYEDKIQEFDDPNANNVPGYDFLKPTPSDLGMSAQRPLQNITPL